MRLNRNFDPIFLPSSLFPESLLGTVSSADHSMLKVPDMSRWVTARLTSDTKY